MTRVTCVENEKVYIGAETMSERPTNIAADDFRSG